MTVIRKDKPHRLAAEHRDAKLLRRQNYLERFLLPRRTSRRVPPRQPPPVRKRMHDRRRPLCPGCGERDRVVMPGEAHPGGEACTAPWCDRCLGYLLALSPRRGRHVPDF